MGSPPPNQLRPPSVEMWTAHARFPRTSLSTTTSSPFFGLTATWGDECDRRGAGSLVTWTAPVAVWAPTGPPSRISGTTRRRRPLRMPPHLACRLLPQKVVREAPGTRARLVGRWRGDRAAEGDRLLSD